MISIMAGGNRIINYFLFTNGFTDSVTKTPALFSFILPKPTPLSGRLIYGAANNEKWELNWC